MHWTHIVKIAKLGLTLKPGSAVLSWCPTWSGSYSNLNGTILCRVHFAVSIRVHHHVKRCPYSLHHRSAPEYKMTKLKRYQAQKHRQRFQNCSTPFCLAWFDTVRKHYEVWLSLELTSLLMCEYWIQCHYRKDPLQISIFELVWSTFSIIFDCWIWPYHHTLLLCCASSHH